MSGLEEVLEGLPDGALLTIGEIAGTVAASDPRLEPGDLVNEYMVWIAEKPRRVSRYYRDIGETVAAFSWRLFRASIRGYMAAVAWRIIREADGYHTEDDAQYRPRQVKALLPYVWNDPDLAIPEFEGRISSGSNLAEGNTRLAEMVDVRGAYSRQIVPGGTWDRVLQGQFRFGQEQQHLAAVLGVSAQHVSKMVAKAVRMICDDLNGAMLPDDCNSLRGRNLLGDGPGSRRVMSNAAAAALTSRQGAGHE